MKIIDMDEFKEDAADRKLREMLALQPLADNDFSDRVVRRVRRDAWRRRLLLGLAIVPGAIFAAGPLLQLGNILAPFLTRLESGLVAASAPLAAVQTGLAIPLVFALLASIFTAIRLLED